MDLTQDGLITVVEIIFQSHCIVTVVSVLYYYNAYTSNTANVISHTHTHTHIHTRTYTNTAYRKSNS